jgi:hypothetical protein
MRHKLLLVLSAMAVAVMLGVASAYADTVTLGDTCTPTNTFTATSPLAVSGTASICQASDESTSPATPLSYSITYASSTTSTFELTNGTSLTGTTDVLDGTIDWTSVIVSGDLTYLVGVIDVTTSTGLGSEYKLGDSTGIDMTLKNGAISSGELSPVPEPATLTLLGSGLLTMAGFFRRKLLG